MNPEEKALFDSLLEEYNQVLLATVDRGELKPAEREIYLKNFVDKIANSYLDLFSGKITVSPIKPTDGTFGKPSLSQLLDLLPEFDTIKAARKKNNAQVLANLKAQAKADEEYKTYLGQKGRQQKLALPDNFGVDKSIADTLAEYDTAYQTRYGLQPSGYKFSGNYDEQGTGEPINIATGVTSQDIIAQQQALQKQNVAYAQEQAELDAKLGRGAYSPEAQIARRQKLYGGIGKGAVTGYDDSGNPIFGEGETLEQSARALADWGQYNRNMAEDRAREAAIMQPPPLKDISGNLLGLAKQTSGGNVNLEEYVQQNIGRVADEFSAKFPGAREAWNAALRPYRPYEGQIHQFNPYPVIVNARPEVAKSYNQAVLASLGKPLSGTETDYTTDPLQSYIQNYDWYKEFISQPAAQRGYQPQRYAPAARWLTG